MSYNEAIPVQKPVGPKHRPLRVLHLGNLANNAYYNAKFLRRIDVEADVMCYDNYWAMSSPEWEEADFEGVPTDQSFPDWSALNLKNYQRPRWFAQGPFALCVRYLIAKQEGHALESDRSWRQLTHAREVACRASHRKVMSSAGKMRGMIADGVYYALKNAVLRIGETFKWISDKANPVTAQDNAEPDFHYWYMRHCQFLIEEFARRFPERRDRLVMEDFVPYEWNVRLIRQLFAHYDVVQAYATDPLYPMLAGFKPYVAFEHGTLRDAPEAAWTYKGPFWDNTLGRLTALSYALADHVFITNADCISSAHRLGLNNYEPMPHPLDETTFVPTDEYRKPFREKLGVKYIFLCPIRHDWVDKGTDRYIRAIPALQEHLGCTFKVCFMPWGKELERSRQLINDLGCNHLVAWVGPFGRVSFARWITAADVVFDQVAYPAFSGITPRALACGVPVIACFDPAGSAWMFEEEAPVLTARTERDIVQNTLTAVAAGFRERYSVQARAWFLKHHSSKRNLILMLQAYRSALEQRAASSESV
jgi:glycosyltransferase involved in cell wall biosynthesis